MSDVHSDKSASRNVPSNDYEKGYDDGRADAISEVVVAIAANPPIGEGWGAICDFIEKEFGNA